MPLNIERITSAGSAISSESWSRLDRVREAGDRPLPTLTIGLVNNMQDGALETTERQFMSLLDAASGDMVIRLRLYQLPDILRGASATRHIAKNHSAVETLWDTELDGLIVTGREPSAAQFQDEPYWGSFVRLLEWAYERTHSTIWSCLAAHAAVYRMDGIPRVRSAHKYSGLFDCDLLTNHPIAAGSPSQLRIPHSRWNGLDEKQLVEYGYEIMTRSESAGVDAFVKRGRSLFVFFQGHPEYEADTLMLEFRRDVARYLRGEAAAYPSLPKTYFNDDTVEALGEIGYEARLFPREELLRDLSAVLERTKLQNSWRHTAVNLYRNWLHQLAAAKRMPVLRSTGVSLPIDPETPKQAIAATELGSKHLPFEVRSIQ